MDSPDQDCVQTAPQLPTDPGFYEYTNPDNPGFLATLKSRPEDFIVTEISSNEKVAVLDNFEVPPPLVSSHTSNMSKKRKRQLSSRPDPDMVPPLHELVSCECYKALKELSDTYKSTLVVDPEQMVDLGVITDRMKRSLLHGALRLTFPALQSLTSKNEQGENCVYAVVDSKYKRLLEALSPEQAEDVLKFANMASSSPDSSLILGPDPSREHRTKVHQILSELYGHYISTKYSLSVKTPYQFSPKTPKLEEGANQPVPAIIVRKRKSRFKPLGAGDKEENLIFTKFVLRKRNLETFDVMHKLSQLLEVHPADFGICGTKDKRAVTTQQVTVKGVSPERLLLVKEELNRDGIDIGNFEFVNHHVSLGEHMGNRFKVVLRDVKPKHVVDDFVDVVTSSLESVKERGFINYFGLQRFGGTMTTPRIGLAMLHKDTRKAVNIALMECSKISSETKELIRNQRFDQALKSIPEDANKERLLLQKLHQYGTTDYAYSRALTNIPYNYRILFVNSLSSLLWNHIANYRIQEYGLKPVEGDLVLKERKIPALSLRNYVHTLTSHDVQCLNYSLEDVVLPVVGSSTIYPNNKVADKTKELMATLGITLASFRMPRLGLNVLGTYRKLVNYPRNLSWQLIKSSPITSPLTEPSIHHHGNETNIANHNTHHETLNLELNFDLGVATYATMFIREIAKNVY